MTEEMKNENLDEEETAEEAAAEESVEEEKEETSEDKEEKKKTKKKLFGKSEDDKVRELEEEIVSLNDKLNAAKNEYFKAYADTENMKKRLQAEFDSRNKYRIQSFALEILPAIDNLERALASADEEDPIYKGVSMVYAQLMNALKNEGVEEVDCLNKPFDSNFCNALMSEAREDVESGTVIEVLQKGYKLKDRILRAALVKVSE